MTANEFEKSLRRIAKRDDEFPNPFKGKTTIVSVTESNVRYRRERSVYSLSILASFDAWQEFRGERINSRMLKKFRPHVFDSQGKPKRGHNCNCTTLFLLLRKMRLVRRIEKEGRTLWVELLRKPH
jgi:hypothetical protein